MAFEDIPKVNEAQFYIDLAFKKAKRLILKRGQHRRVSKLERARLTALRKIQAIADSIKSRFERIIKTFPSTDALTKFYKAMLSSTIGIVRYKKALAAIAWASKRITKLNSICSSKIKKSTNAESIRETRREFYGRTASIIKQINPSLKILELARKRFRTFPKIKKMPTFAIAGFPNVGKTTLLSKLSGSMPAIAPYPFTTLTIMVGYAYLNNKRIQLLDTPGTLARPDKMNAIELQAYHAMRFAADAIIYIFDLTEPYPLEKQERLFKKLKRLKKPMIVYLSKTDIIDKKTILRFLKKLPKAATSTQELKKMIVSMLHSMQR